MAKTSAVKYDPGCVRCPRIAAELARIRCDYPDYHARPVAPFGVANPRLLIVGLGPGMHGANATGRPFTGDFAGILLYQTLYDYGFSTRPESVSADDGLRLIDCRITNAVKCLPPANKPTGIEIRNCNGYLREELAGLRSGTIILALGRIAHEAVLRALDLRVSAWRFAHHAIHELESGHVLLDSYHCSRYNTQTGRLTPDMFAGVMATARRLVNG